LEPLEFGHSLLFLSYLGSFFGFGFLLCLNLSLKFLLPRLHQLSLLLDFSPQFFHLLIGQEVVLDDNLFAYTLQIPVMARCHASYRVRLGQLEQGDADGSADILENIDAVVGSANVFVVGSIPVSLRFLALDLVRIQVVLRSQHIYPLPSLEVALEGVTVD